jgi:hypothetical protein
VFPEGTALNNNEIDQVGVGLKPRHMLDLLRELEQTQ